MLTLTYRPGAEWKAKQVADFFHRLRQYATRSGFDLKYVWVMELTQRGVPHYHILIRLPLGRTLPKPDKQGWWPYGMTRIEWARVPVGYIAKYASKGDEATKFPKGARIAGFGGLDKAGRIECSWWKLPVWVREVFNEIAPVSRTLGGYVHRVTGEFLRSPYRVKFEFGVMVVYEV